MKVSCIPLDFLGAIAEGKASVEEWAAMAGKLELDGVEFYMGFVPGREPEAVQRAARLFTDRGLSISMLTGYSDFIHPDAEERERQIREVKEQIDLAALIGAPYVRLTPAGRRHSQIAYRQKVAMYEKYKFPDGKPPSDFRSIPYEQALKWAGDGLRECVAYAASKGRVIALEDHPPFGCTIREFTDVLDATGDPRLKVNLDTSNVMEAGEGAVELTEIVADRVVHVHASDRDAALEHVVTGEGVVDFPGVFRILKEHGFDGWLSPEAVGTSEEKLARALGNVRRMWEQA